MEQAKTIDKGVQQQTSLTSKLLTCGMIVGPFYIIVGLLQVLMRDGFDIRRHALSLLSNGQWGWVQIGNFVISGLLLIAFAIGMRRALKDAFWAPLLIGIYGLSLIAAGVFVADPALGFPVGTPDGPHSAITWHGNLHFMAGGIGFIGFIAACFVFARRFAREGEMGWMAYSIATGVLFFAAFAGIASGVGTVALNLAFTAAVILSWIWIGLIAMRLKGRLNKGAIE